MGSENQGFEMVVLMQSRRHDRTVLASPIRMTICGRIRTQVLVPLLRKDGQNSGIWLLDCCVKATGY